MLKGRVNDSDSTLIARNLPSEKIAFRPNDLVKLFELALENNHYWLFIQLFKYQEIESKLKEAADNPFKQILEMHLKKQPVAWFCKTIEGRNFGGMQFTSSARNYTGTTITDLHLAILNKDLKAIEILATGVDNPRMFVAEYNMKQPLELAIELDYSAGIQKIVPNIVGYDATTVISRSILFALENKKYKIALEIANWSGHLNVLLQGTSTILCLLAKNGQLNLIKDYHTLFSFDNKNNYKVILDAAIAGELEVVQYILGNTDIPVYINQFVDKNGERNSEIKADIFDLIYKKWQKQEEYKLGVDFNNTTTITPSSSYLDMNSSFSSSPSSTGILLTDGASLISSFEDDSSTEGVEASAVGVKKHDLIDKPDDHFGGCTPLHKAIQFNNELLINHFLNLGASCFVKNNAKLNPIELTLAQNNQKVFNILLKSLKNADYSQAPSDQTIPYSKSLQYITAYWKENPPSDYKQITFLWNFLLKLQYDKVDRADRTMTAYVFKQAYLFVSQNNAKNNYNTIISTTMTSPIDESKQKLAARVKELVILHQQNNMLAVNTCRRWLNFGWGLGKSVIHAQLEKIVNRVHEVVGGELKDLSSKSHILLEKLHEAESTLHTELHELIVELDNISKQRVAAYVPMTYVPFTMA